MLHLTFCRRRRVWKLHLFLTVGDAAENGYRMVGIPDGLGALGNGQTFSLFMNHELTASAGSSGPGIVRAHGNAGAFVSKWTIDRKSLRVLAGEDLTPSPNHVRLWNVVTQQYQAMTTTWDRLCSADLPKHRMKSHPASSTRSTSLVQVGSCSSCSRMQLSRILSWSRTDSC